MSKFKALQGALQEPEKHQMVEFLKQQQTALLDMFTKVDGTALPKRRCWERPLGGGGEMATLRGKVVEKAGCNVSVVHGAKYPGSSLARGSESDVDELAGKPFFATGLSTIVHMYNPNAPIAHLNVRLFQVGESFWFGGGADLTPFKPFREDTEDFHAALKRACERCHPQAERAYEEYREWCERYFYISHRKEPRGVGGIFFDRLQCSFSCGFSFIRELMRVYAETLQHILTRRKDMSYTDHDKEQQLYWRGRYVEFNLLYDRGTKFGLQTGGDLDAIFVSLPPTVKW